MTKYLIDEELMASIADATKEKKGLDAIEAEDIPEAIASISGDAVLETLSVTENGTYTPTTGVDGYDEVVVNISSEDSYAKYLERQDFSVSTTGTQVPPYCFIGYDYSSDSRGWSGDVSHNHLIKFNGPNVTYIGPHAFHYQTKLTEVTVSSSGCGLSHDSNLSDNAFEYCQSLNKIHGKLVISKNVYNQVPSRVFEGCSALKSSSFDDWSGITAINERMFRLSGIDTFDFQYIQTVMGSGQFYMCGALTTVNLRNLSGLSNSMFFNCGSLSNIYIEKTDAVVGVGPSALYGVPSTCNVHVPASMLASYQADGNWNGFNLIGDSEPPVMLMMAKKGKTAEDRPDVDEDGSPIYYND